MPSYLFTIVLKGTGATPEAAWQDAIEAFAQDPGEFDQYEIDPDDENPDAAPASAKPARVPLQTYPVQFHGEIRRVTIPGDDRPAEAPDEAQIPKLAQAYIDCLMPLKPALDDVIPLVKAYLNLAEDRGIVLKKSPPAPPCEHIPHKQDVMQTVCENCGAELFLDAATDTWKAPAKPENEEPPAMRPLYKSTIVIWSKDDPTEMDLSELAREAEQGACYCSKQVAAKIENPAADPGWDGTEFFEGEDESEAE